MTVKTGSHRLMSIKNIMVNDKLKFKGTVEMCDR